MAPPTVEGCCSATGLQSTFAFARDRMQSTAGDVLERLIEGTYTRARQNPLLHANLGIEKLRFLFRLATDMR
jgi:hypothetical protein